MSDNIFNKMSAFFFKKKNKNKDFTLIARDCIGGILYHQLGLRFLSPAINLFFTPEDFNFLCLNLKEYMDGELVELKDDSVDYPVGLLHPVKESKIDKPIRVSFMHYETFDIAKAKWDERKARINYKKIYVVSSFCYSTEVETLNDKLIEDWNKIEYKKVVLVDKHYGFNDEFIIKKNKKCKEFAWLLYSPNKTITWKRTFNKFNFINFLNKN